MIENPDVKEKARLTLLLAVIRRDLPGAVDFIARFSEDRRPLDRLMAAWRELNERDPMMAAGMHEGVRLLERRLPSDPDRALEEYRAEINALRDFVPAGTEIKTNGDIREASDREIARLAQELRPEQFTE